MKKVWKAGIAGLAALSIGAAGFIGTTAAFADPTTPTTPTTTTASTTSSITVNDTDEGRTYNAYQIFKGKVAADHTLSDIEWGANITAAGKAALINAINTSMPSIRRLRTMPRRLLPMQQLRTLPKLSAILISLQTARGPRPSLRRSLELISSPGLRLLLLRMKRRPLIPQRM